MLIEVGWEVCWQLGGIYTVLRSKAPAMMSRWEDEYCLVGPYNPASAAVEFEELEPKGVMADALAGMAKAGIPCKYGKWLITGRPPVVLIDYLACMNRLGEYKYRLWKDHGISTPSDDFELNNTIVFGYLTADLLDHVVRAIKQRNGGKSDGAPGWPVIAHFHEWMAGAGLPEIRRRQLPVRTVFTTHATLLGRYICSDQVDLYGILDHVNPDHMAGKYNIYPRFAIERSAAHSAHVFTTVSEVTAREATKLLGRRPEVVTPNGLNIQRFAAVHEFQNLHRVYKERIHDFTMGHFFPSYTFDLDRTLYLFTAGRYEYRNKGYDLFIESLARLNWKLKQERSDMKVIAFIIAKASVRSINVGVLQSHIMFRELRRTCESIQEEMGAKLFRGVAMGKLPSRVEDLIDEYATVRVKRMSHAWRQKGLPTIVTHDLAEDAADPILAQLRACRLYNAQEDPVKVVFHPEFLTASNPLLGLDYSDFVRGCHMGVFPSYYEPWGYTPMECIARGVPTITTDLAGFGSYVIKHVGDPEEKGIHIVKRADCDFNTAAQALADKLVEYCLLSQRERIELRNRVEGMAEHFDWNNLARHYSEAYELALRGA